MLQQYIWTSGPVVYPLIVCSVLTLALIVERLLVFVAYRPLSVSKTKMAGLALLNQHKNAPKQLRDEVMTVWVMAQRTKLQAHTRWLTLLSALAPLLGLLGTVLGIITMFQSVAVEQGPVTPALLASGMWEAMITTALGLVIAIPAMAASHGFSIWADHRMTVIAQALNEHSLLLEQGLEQYKTGAVIQSQAA